MTLELKELSIGWPDLALLSAFSLTVSAGEIAMIQGPSGCGKSTLLSAIAGTSDPQLQITGDIYLNGTLLNQAPPQQRRIAILFQEALLFPHLTVAENLAFGLADGLSRSARQMAVIEALQQADLTGYGDKDPAHLSGGQKARIAMMRAMLCHPHALLMDESFASLDPSLRSQFGQFVADKIAETKIPALLISHHEDDRQFATGKVIHWPQTSSEAKAG